MEYRILLVGRKGTFMAPIKEEVEVSDVLKRHGWLMWLVVAGDGWE